ncbi:hypothetical protein DXM25_19375 [Agrobacterium rosae]|nr:hypothetical protein DXM25_19375 [Agrobacterium rosae]MQB50286.1 hypothetical protein [Agrobacterium rosae]
MQTSQEFDDFGLLFNIEGDGWQSAGARVAIGGRFKGGVRPNRGLLAEQMTIDQTRGKVYLFHSSYTSKRQPASAIIVLCKFPRTNCLVILRWTIQV